MLAERRVTITQCYALKAYHPRTVTIDEIPALELTADGETEIALESAVCARLEILRDRAFAENDLRDQRFRYTPSDDPDIGSSRSNVATVHMP